ncbi:hypothetical protein P7K49_024492 [Saguinus oedipus]|uniref:Uncharacterized protein n=1 Tax=Saguinus oedipus TaxID=9490 RepID=A0ABQ9UPQ5_SAGOE|nr:hypothetical protein P7K49_024492 [Saguinus oedipus]
MGGCVSLQAVAAPRPPSAPGEAEASERPPPPRRLAASPRGRPGRASPGRGGAPCRPRRAERAEGTRAGLPPCPNRSCSRSFPGPRVRTERPPRRLPRPGALRSCPAARAHLKRQGRALSRSSARPPRPAPAFTLERPRQPQQGRRRRIEELSRSSRERLLQSRDRMFSKFTSILQHAVEAHCRPWMAAAYAPRRSRRQPGGLGPALGRSGPGWGARGLGPGSARAPAPSLAAPGRRSLPSSRSRGGGAGEDPAAWPCSVHLAGSQGALRAPLPLTFSGKKVA